MDHQAPNQQPNNGQQPNYGYQQPNYGYQQPNYGQQSPYGYQQPPYGYQQPPYGYQQPPYGQSMPPAQIPIRDLAVYIILSIVTCGIFAYYWLYCLNEDMRSLTGDYSFMSGGMVVLLSIVTCGIYLFVWMYQMGDKLDQVKSRYGFFPGNTGIVYLLLSIFGLSLVAQALLQNELNKLPR